MESKLKCRLIYLDLKLVIIMSYRLQNSKSLKILDRKDPTSSNPHPMINTRTHTYTVLVNYELFYHLNHLITIFKLNYYLA